MMLSEDDKKLLQKAKDKLARDLRERPLDVLVGMCVASYELDRNHDPMILSVTTRYNGKKYTFHISSIDIEEEEEPGVKSW